MFLNLLLFRFNSKEESEESLDNPLPNSLMSIILLRLISNSKEESEASLDNPLPNSLKFLI